MKCNKVIANEYIDKTLNHSKKLKFEAHLKSCKNCRLEIEYLKKIKGSLSKLPKEIMPETDLFENILAEIETKPNRSFFKIHFKTVISAAALILLLISFFIYNQSSNSQTQIIVQNNNEEQFVQTIALLEVEYSKTKTLLKTTLFNSRGKLSQNTIFTLEKNLEVIDDATENIRAVLATNGANKELLNLYYQSYLTQVKLLQHTVKILLKQKGEENVCIKSI